MSVLFMPGVQDRSLNDDHFLFIIHPSFFSLFVLALAFPSTAQPYVRQVDAFQVVDESGEAYAHPWLGGLDVPRPQFVDIDGDQDLDLFVQERPGQLIFFENIGTPTRAIFAWRSDSYGGLDVGEWVRFGDLDGDGDTDMLAEEPFSLIRYYRNAGTPAQPDFHLAADTLRDADGAIIFFDRQNIPALADIDCDEDLDLFLPHVNGTLTFYENVGTDAAGIPQFRFVTETYQNLLIVGGPGKQGDDEHHGAASIAFSDVDRDGDLDLLWGDFNSESLYFIENLGTCEAPDLERVSDVFPLIDPLQTSGYNAPTFADIDGDGDSDLFAGELGGIGIGGSFAANNFYYYRHDDGISFTLQTRQFIASLDVDESSIPAFADLDADGDLDLLVGNRIDPVDRVRGQLVYVENTGTPAAPVFRVRGEALVVPEDGVFDLAPAFADLDADGDFDLLVGHFNGSLLFYRNDGTTQTPVFAAPEELQAEQGGGVSERIDVGQDSTPALADIDADGDLDLFVGEASGVINFFRNDGTASVPRFVLVSERFEDIDTGTRSVPAFHDTDRDGLLDLIAGTEQKGLVVYRNAGSLQQPGFPNATSLDLPGLQPDLTAPAFADSDGDSDADLFLGAKTGGLFFYRNDRIPTALGPVLEVSSQVVITNHPNPFHCTTTLNIRLDQPGRVQLTVYDLLGRTVAVPVNAWLAAGDHAVRLDAESWPAGVYVYTLLGAGLRATGSLVRLHKF